ncbi:MAG TPA: hypothetical protein DFR83_09085, partial [Deltaproteobacteria bacterium]|nr:hypothetical protein [Deltaproteobacteria bacterium]
MHTHGVSMVRTILPFAFLIACGPPPKGVDYRGTRLAVVDMHLHPGDWQQVPESTQGYLASRFPFPFGLRPEQVAEGVLTGEAILDQLDDAAVSAAILFAVYAPRTVGVATNELVLRERRADTSRLWGLASLPVDRWDESSEAALAALSEALDNPGMVGIKLAHAHMHFRMDDPAYFSIYDMAVAHDAPVYLHTGTSPFPGTRTEPEYTDPAYLEAAIATHPRVQFILGHMGYDFIDQRPGDADTAIDLAVRYDNVWLEPSALGSRGSDPTGTNLPLVLKKAKTAGVEARLIYGSDGPQSPGFAADYLERTLTALEAADYSVEEAQLILADNASSLFGIPTFK